jgi:hypothetical protein
VTAPERYRLIKIMEHLPDVERYRASLDPAERRRQNHPSLWYAYRKATKATAKRVNVVIGSTPRPSRKHGRSVYWSADHIRRHA